MPMTAGFPRPRKLVKQIKVDSGYRYPNNDFDKWNNRTYPIPYTARMMQVGKVSNTRLEECKAGRLCIVCGVQVTDKRPWAYVWDANGYTDVMVSDSGPFHEKCVTITKTQCPVVSENLHMFRFLQVSWNALEARHLPRSQRKDYRKVLANEKKQAKTTQMLIDEGLI